MNKRKGLYKYLTFILTFALIIQMLPANSIKVEAEENTTLNVMDGIITITNQSYVQKTSSGTIVNQGSITGELILTGTQGGTNNITLNGTNIPTIHFKGVNTAGYITGTATGTLNVIVEGNCTFSNGIINSLTAMTNVNVSGVEGNSITGPNGNGFICPTNDVTLTVDGLNIKPGTNTVLITTSKNIKINNCTYAGDKILQISTPSNLGSAYTAEITNCNFSNLTPYFGSNIIIDNVTVTGIASSSQYTFNYTAGCTTTIKNSDLKGTIFSFGGDITKIINSKVETVGYYFNAQATGTLYIEGSTLINSGTSYDVYTNSNSAVCLLDNSLIFKGSPTVSTSRFYNMNTSVKAKFDPVDPSGNFLYLNKVKVPGASNSRVTVSIDGRSEVNLWTDSDGYLYLYLPTGQHNVDVIDINGIEYADSFSSMAARETSTTSNVVGDLETVAPPVTVTYNPYNNESVQYSFDFSTWTDITTDENCQFKISVPSWATKIYLKAKGKISTGVINEGGSVDDIVEAMPVIKNQSKSPSTFLKGEQGVLFITAEPFFSSDTLTYQWYKDGIKIEGATGSIYTISNAQVTDNGNYTCEVSEINAASSTSTPISVLITDGSSDTGELKILSQSNNKTLIEGYSTELYVNAKAARSSDDLTYEWYKDGEIITAASQSAIVLNSVTTEDSGAYTCRVYEDQDYIEADPIQVTVEKNPLEDNVNDLNSQVENLTSQVGTLTDQLNTLSNEKNNLQETIDGLANQISSYTKQITTLQNTITDLESQLLNSDGDKDELTQQIHDLNNLINNLNQQISTLEDELFAAQGQKTVLESQVNDLTGDITNLNSQITLLEHKLEDSEEENANLKSQVNSLQETVSNLENQIIDFQDEVGELADQNNQLLSQAEELTSQKVDLENEIHRLSDLLDDADTTIGNLTEQVNTLTEAVDDLQNQLNTASGEKTLLQNTITGLQEEITGKDTKIAELNNQLAELSDALQQEGADQEVLNETISNLNIQITNLNQNISSLQSQLDDVTGQRDALQDTVDDLSSQLTDYKYELNNLKEVLADSEEENSSLNVQITELQNVISNLNKNIADLDSQLDSLSLEYNSLHSQLDEANDTIQVLLNQISELLQDNTSLQEQLSYAQVQIDKLTSDLTAEQQKNVNLQNELSEALDDIRNIAAQLGSSSADKQDILISINDLKDEINSLNNQLQNSNGVINTLNEQIVNLSNIAAALQSKISDAIGDLSDYEGEELLDKIASIINDNKTLSDQASELEEQNNTLLEQITQMNDTINNLLDQIGNLEDENSNLTQLLNQAEETIDSLQEQLTKQLDINNELQNQINELVSDMDDLQSQLINADVDKEVLQIQISDLQAEINFLTKQLTESNGKITGLNKQIEDMNKIIENLQNQIDDALDSLSEYDGNNLIEKLEDVLKKQEAAKEYLDSANSLNNDLCKQLADATGQLSYLQAEIERLTGVLEDKDAEIERLNALLQQQNTDNAALTAKVADLENQNQALEEENEFLKQQIEEGNPDKEEELQQLRNEISEKDKQLTDANATIESLKNKLSNQSSGSSGTVASDDEYVVVPQTSTSNNVEEIVKETVISNSNEDGIESNSGWELSSSLSADAEWGNTLQPSQYSSYTGVFTFFDNGLSSSDVQTLSANTIGKKELLSISVPGIGLQEKNLLSDSASNNYVKYTFYARRVNDKNKIYVCEVNVIKTDYTTPVTMLTSSVLDDPRNYTPQNTYTTKVDGKIVFRPAANFGDIGKASIAYQLVPENEDFDPDGKWIEVSGDTFTVPKQKENYRVYVKYTDKAGNFTVDKTVGFNVTADNAADTNPEEVTRTSVPVFEIGKTIELGNSYKINLANITKGAEITFSSNNNKVVTVSKTGVITSKGLGNAIVSGIVKDGDYTYKFIVEVSVVKGVYDSTLNLKQISTINSVDGKPVVVIYKLCSKGESIKLNAQGASDAQITYICSNEKIATVSKEGKVAGKSKGRANITVTVTQDGISYTYMVVIRVTDGTDDSEMWDYLA